MTTPTHFNLGDKLRDNITGFEGVATGRHTFVSGTVQYSLTPTTLDEKGKPQDGVLLDWQHLVFVQGGVVPSHKPASHIPQYRLGDEVADEFTNFRGSITSKSEFINGCVQYGVQPRKLRKGNMINPRLIDSQRLVLLGRNENATVGAAGGGPEYMPV